MNIPGQLFCNIINKGDTVFAGYGAEDFGFTAGKEYKVIYVKTDGSLIIENDNGKVDTYTPEYFSKINKQPATTYFTEVSNTINNLTDKELDRLVEESIEMIKNPTLRAYAKGEKEYPYNITIVCNKADYMEIGYSWCCDLNKEKRNDCKEGCEACFKEHGIMFKILE